MTLRTSHRPAKARSRLSRVLQVFRRTEDGNASVEFVMLFPAIMMLFCASMEAGLYSMRQVMLERGLDLTVRDVRLGLISNPDHDKLVAATCKYALILDKCTTNLRLEMIKANPSTFAAPSKKVQCIDVTKDSQPPVAIVNGMNNDVMILRACVMLKPTVPGATFGRTLVENGQGKYYSLSATAAYVMEPFQWGT